MKHEAVAAPGPEQAGVRSGFWKDSLRDYGLLFSLLVIMGFFYFMTDGISLAPLNVMYLTTPNSAILSAVVFNALIIVALIPLAIKGVKYRPLGAGRLLRRNLLVYGLGGIIAPFPGIKLIDMGLAAVGLA